jgi:hypothetical protein
MPRHLQDALDSGYLTQAQLRELIEFEADRLGFGFDEAVQRARADTLPRNANGTDLRALVSLLAV